MAKLPVKMYRFTDQGAPQMDNSWGDLIKVLDACLVNGYNEQDVASMSASGSLVTVVVSGPHGYEPHDPIEISGANEADFNGEWRVLDVLNATTLTFNMIGNATTATGSIKIKKPPLGFEKVFGDAETGAYRSANLQSSRNFLRVDDRLKPNKGFGDYNTKWAKWANVGIVENMVDFDTLLGAQCPYSVSNPKANWESTAVNEFGWAKWYHSAANYISGADAEIANAGIKSWVLIGDDRAFYLFVSPHKDFPDYYICCYFFGDVARDYSASTSPVLCSHLNRRRSNVNIGFSVINGGAPSFVASYRTGSFISPYHTNGVKSNNELFITTNLLRRSNQSVMMNEYEQVPVNALNFSYEVSPMFLSENYTMGFFGKLPGIYFTYFDQRVFDNSFFLYNKEKNRKYAFIRVVRGNNTASSELSFPGFDITGPWR